MFDFEKRRAGLYAALDRAGMAGALLTLSRDVYYFTGVAQPACLAVSGNDWRLYIRAGLDFAAGVPGLDPERLVRVRRMEQAAEMAFSGPTGAPVGLALDALTANQSAAIIRALGRGPVADVSPLVLDLRMVKDEEEIRAMERSARALHAGHLAVLEMLEPGVGELEVAAEYERAIRLAGHNGATFMRLPDFVMGPGPLASGENLDRHTGLVFTISGVGLSPALPVGPSRRKLARGDLMVVDIPTCVEGYHCDQSRTYSVGLPPRGAAGLFDGLKGVMDDLAGALRPGQTAGQAYDIALEAARDRGMAEELSLFPDGGRAHFVGHGIGLEVNEPPLLARGSTAPLKENMTLALEFHLRRNGLTVKLEDTVVLTDRGCRVLSPTPRRLFSGDRQSPHPPGQKAGRPRR